jgi:hypothetical protein
MGADEVDNTLSHPASQAEALAHRERVQYATMAALAQAQAEQNEAQAAHQAWLNQLAADYSEYASEEAAADNGGENPLLYLAAMQTLAGGMTENYSPISGYLLSQDGQIDYPRAMSGRIVPGMGQGVQSLIQSAQAAAQPVQSLVQAVTGGGAAAAAPAASPAAAPAASGLAATFQNLMGQKVGGVPVPYIAGGVLLLWLLKK